MPDIQQYSVSIKYKTEGADKAAKDSDKVKDSLGKLKSSTKGFESLKTGFSTVAGFTSKVAKGVKVAAVAIGTGLVKAGKSANKYSKEMMDYIETMNLFRASMGDLADKAMELVNEGEFKLGINPEDMMDAIASFQNLSEGFGIASDRAYLMSSNLAQLAGDLSSFANISYEAAQKKLMSGFSGQVLPLRQYGIALDQASLQELAYSLGLEQRVKTMTRAQKTELIYYQIMKSTQKMQGDLGRTLMSPANALRVLQNEFKSLARAVGSIFIPIMQKIIPIMRAVTKALTQAAQAIASFFGFNIENYTSDLDSVGGGLEGITDDIDDVGGAAEGTAKKLNKMLMPFDELNNINSSDSSGSGSGSGSGLSGGSLGLDLPSYNMFEFIDDRIEKFSDVLEKAKNAAQKFNELLREIDWKQIQETAGVVGSSIAEFLNIGITDVDWNLVGSTFAEGINTIFETVYSFVTTFKWGGLGESIADTINGMFDNIDFAKIGQTLTSGISGLFKTVYTTLEEIDWWNLAEDVETFIGNIDWGKIASSVFRGLGAALGGITTFVGKIIADGIEGIGEFFNDRIEESGGNIALGILKGITDIFINIADWIKDNIFGPFIEGFKNAFGIGSGSSSIMEEEGKSLMSSFADGMQIEDIGEIWEKVKSIIFEKVQDIRDGVIDIFTGVIKGIVRGVETSVNKIIDGINEVIDAINLVGDYLGIHLQPLRHVEWADEFDKKMDRMFKKSEETMEGIDWATKTGMENMNKNIQNPLNIISNDFNTTFGGLEKTTTENLGAVEKAAGIKSSAIQSVISTSFSKAKKDAQTNTAEIKTTTENNLQNLANSSVYSRIKTSITTALDNAKKARELGGSTATGYKEGFEGTASHFSIMSTVKDRFRQALGSYSEARQWGSDMATGFKDGLNAKQQEIIDKVRGMANSIRSLLHFSRPDEGPLRDYETWMPDMIKGLSDSLLKAQPVLDNAVNIVADKIANTLGSVTVPNVEQSVYSTGYNTEIIKNIGNKMPNTSKDETTTNMIRATYEAVSRALSDNPQNDERQPINIYLGNKTLYKGYGQYQDEQSNMLGVTV